MCRTIGCSCRAPEPHCSCIEACPFGEFPLVSPNEKGEHSLLIAYWVRFGSFKYSWDLFQVRLGTAWIGSEYGLAWLGLRFRDPL